MIVNVVLLQDSAPIVVEVDANLFAAVNPVTSEYWLTACGDPDPGKGIGVDLIPFNDASSVVML